MSDQQKAATGRAALAIFVYALLVGYIDNYVRVIAAGTGLWQFQAVRSGLALIAVFGLIWLPWLPKLRLHAPAKVAARTAIQCAAMFIYFGSLGFLSVAQAAAGLFSAPIFVLILGRVLYGHRVGVVGALAALAGFAGVLMVLAPDPQDIGLATLVPILGGALYGLTSLTTREWCAGENALSLTVVYMAAMGVLASIILAGLWLWSPEGSTNYLSRGPNWPSGEVLFWIGAQAIGSVVAVAMMVHAYQLAEASKVSVFEYMVLPISALWSWLIYGEGVGKVAALGMVIIIAAGITMAQTGKRVAPV